MGYEKILKELGFVNDTGISMKALRKLAGLFQNANTVYGNELLNNREDAKKRYDEVIGRIREVAFNKLKKQLGFEDEVIEKIITLMLITNRIEEIYVINGDVLAQIDNTVYTNERDVLYSASNNNYLNVNYKKFNNSDNIDCKTLLISVLNNALRPFTHVNADERVLSINGDVITYNIPNLSIYINNSLEEIFSDKTGTVISNVIVKYNDMLLNFDLKIRDEYVIVSQNEYRVNVISEMLNNNTKELKK